jgi:hypothetical protein
MYYFPWVAIMLKNDTAAGKCPFCGKPLKNALTCGRTACQAKAAVWSSKRR